MLYNIDVLASVLSFLSVQMTGFQENVKITICGGGNGAHVLAGVSSLVRNAHVTVLDVYEDEAERWTRTMADTGFTVQFSNGERLCQPPGNVNFSVTRDVEHVVPKTDILIICVPSYTHEIYLSLVSPYLSDTCTVVGMPGQPGFEYQALSILNAAGKKCSILSIETLPWACRIAKYGHTVDVMGTKEEVLYFLKERVKTELCNGRPAEVLQAILGPKPELKREKNLLKYIFQCRPTIHPPIMYARWKEWDGTPLDAPPLFYQGVDEQAVSYLDSVTEEMSDIATALSAKFPDMDFSGVSTMQQWLIDHYSEQIEDTRSLLTCLKTNKAYDGLVHPMTKIPDGKYIPQFGYRYLREDVPYGLLVIRQIADMVGVKTPVVDEVIIWAQSKLGSEYLNDNKLCSVDRAHGRLPMAYGINTIEDYVTLRMGPNPTFQSD